MRKDITIAAEARDSRGKNEARRLRAKGSMPAILYGEPGTPEAVAVNPKELSKILNSKTGHNTIFNLELAGGEKTPVMIVDWQHDPIKDNLLHVDLKRIDLTKRIHVMIPVVTHGDPKGVKLQGGLLELVTREVEIECLPDEIPEQFDFDVSELQIGQSIRVSDIPMSGTMKLLGTADTVVAHVVSLKAEAEPAAAEAAPAAAEPEVVKKGKKEEAAEESKKK
ncbi:MAG TPA: 50S ribosomal protein L25 [Bryobacteraceae bacterium]|nr:50S ribosomal protein L25 [Bryobacteraceae bacterium]